MRGNEDPGDEPGDNGGDCFQDWVFSGARIWLGLV